MFAQFKVEVSFGHVSNLFHWLVHWPAYGRPQQLRSSASYDHPCCPGQWGKLPTLHWDHASDDLWERGLSQGTYLPEGGRAYYYALHLTYPKCASTVLSVLQTEVLRDAMREMPPTHTRSPWPNGRTTSVSECADVQAQNSSATISQRCERRSAVFTWLLPTSNFLGSEQKSFGNHCWSAAVWGLCWLGGSIGLRAVLFA